MWNDVLVAIHDMTALSPTTNKHIDSLFIYIQHW